MNDFFNGCLEFVGALLILRNCRILHLHKRVQGVSVAATVYFTMWASWNLYFYPAIGCWFSFAGALCLASANIGWVVMAIYHIRKPVMDRLVAQDLPPFDMKTTNEVVHGGRHAPTRCRIAARFDPTPTDSLQLPGRTVKIRASRGKELKNQRLEGNEGVAGAGFEPAAFRL
jgi:hypothetical protein